MTIDQGGARESVDPRWSRWVGGPRWSPGALRLEVKLRDPQTMAELMTGKPQVDPCSWVEQLEETRV